MTLVLVLMSLCVGVCVVISVPIHQKNTNFNEYGFTYSNNCVVTRNTDTENVKHSEFAYGIMVPIFKSGAHEANNVSYCITLNYICTMYFFNFK